MNSINKSIRAISQRARTAPLLILLGFVLVPLITVVTVRALAGSGAHNRGVILFAGDSNISYGGKWPVFDMTFGEGGLMGADHMDNNYVLAFAARIGSGIRTKDCISSELASCTTYDYWKIKLGETFAQVQPDALVVNLGINDSLDVGTATTQGYGNYAQKIDWFMNLIPSSTPVFWTNLPCSLEPPAYVTGCQKINYFLSQAHNRWPNFVLVNWMSVAGSHTEYMDSASIADYRVHYSDAGYAAWSELVTNTLDSQFPAN
jgi:lysophospholipase L1-like esterase